MSGDLPDKDFLYGKYQAKRDWRNRLASKLAHKSLDIDEDEDVNVDNSRIGIGWKELAVIGLMGLGGAWIYNNTNNNTTPPAATVQPGNGPIDSEYEVRFYDADGNPIDVPHISTRKGQ
jgi:hypothetical protein